MFIDSSILMRNRVSCIYIYIYIYFYLGFLSRTFTIHRTAEEGGGYLFNSFLPLPPDSQTLRHQPGDYCRELTSAHSQQPDSNRELLVSERKSLTTKLRALVNLCERPKRHQILLAKSNHYGIRGVSNDWFKSCLSNRNQYVSINGYELLLLL